MSMQVKCPVCSTAILGRVKYCECCETPHHSECWDYCEGCAVFGCQLTVRRTRRQASSALFGRLEQALRYWILFQEFNALALLMLAASFIWFALSIIGSLSLSLIPSRQLMDLIFGIVAISTSSSIAFVLISGIVGWISYIYKSHYYERVSSILGRYTPAHSKEPSVLIDRLEMTEGDQQIVRMSLNWWPVLRSICHFCVPIAICSVALRMFDVGYSLDQFSLFALLITIPLLLGGLAFSYGRQHILIFASLQSRFLASFKDDVAL